MRVGTAWERHVVDMAARRLNRNRPAWTDLEEIRQECWAALLVVARQTGCRDMPYVIRAVQNHVIEQWRVDGDLTRLMLADNAVARDENRRPPWAVMSAETLTARQTDDGQPTAVDHAEIDPGFERVETLTDAARLWRAVMAVLNEREQRIVIAVYADGRTMADIAVELHVSDTRVSQILAAALRRARLRLGLTRVPPAPALVAANTRKAFA